jgi:hypothetical protein
LVPFGDEPLLLGLGEIGLPKLQGHPAGRRVGDLLLPHLVLVSETQNAHLWKLRLGAVKELRSAREMQQWWRWKSKEPVNSKNPTLPLIKLPDEGTWAETWRKKRKR